MDLLEELRLVKAVVEAPRHLVVGAAAGWLVYGSTSGGTYHLYALDLGGGGTRRITREPPHLSAGVHHSSPYVVYDRDVSRGAELSRIYAHDLRTGEELDVMGSLRPQRITGLAFDGARVAWSGGREEAGIYLARPGSEPELLAKVGGFEFVTDVNDRYVVGHGHLRGDPRSMELFVLDLSTGQLRAFTPREGTVNVQPVLRGGEVLFISDLEGPHRPYVYRPDTGEVRRLRYPELEAHNPVEVHVHGVGDSGEHWLVAKRDGRTALFVDGRPLPTPPGFITSAAVYRGKVYLAHSSLRQPPRILRADLRSGAVEVLVDNRLPPEVEARLGEVRFVRFRSFDGLEIPTYVLRSAAAPTPGPAVVYPHGGPWSEVADMWSPFVAALAVLGLHVVAPNFRGSTGYGEQFRKLDIGDPGGGDLMDVVYARRWAVEAGLAEEGRVAIAGYSYGGYMTFLAMARFPDLWRCGVAGAGITDWEEDYRLADAYFKRFDEVLFAGRMELFRERSPIAYVENVKGPICIIHPQNDSRTPLRPVLRFAQRLEELGRPFELHVIPDVGHAISLDSEALFRFFVYAAAFLRRCMGPPASGQGAVKTPEAPGR